MTVARLALVAALALLGACHKREAAAGALDAGADARARTAAKTLADITAAEQASGTPLPRAPAPRPAEAAAAPSPPPVETDAVNTIESSNGNSN